MKGDEHQYEDKHLPSAYNTNHIINLHNHINRITKAIPKPISIFSLSLSVNFEGNKIYNP